MITLFAGAWFDFQWSVTDDMAMVRVSVIMNVRDGSAYLREALDSVLTQTFTDWELIFWDDRSSDDSAKIVAEYPDQRIRYFLSPEVTPLGQACANAIRQARGEWLAFLDQDDIWLPHKLQQQMDLVEGDSTVGIVYGRTLMFSTGRWEREYDQRHEFQPLPEGDIFERLFADSCFISMSSSVIRRSAVDEIGGIPDEFETSPDYYLFVAVARRYQARAVQRVVCRYRLHASNMSHSNRRKMHQEALWVIDRWAGCLNARLVARRRRIHQSIVALAEMQRLSTLGSGVTRLFTLGSPGFLMSRPFARMFRAMRRRVRRPFWLELESAQPNVKRESLTAADESGSLPGRSTRCTPLPFLSVIVVNWNVRDLLRVCLRSLDEHMLMSREAWEVIVVDNNSSDGSVEMVREEFPNATLVVNRENFGFAKANNQAFRICHGTYVLLLNPDTVVLDHAIDSMVNLMKDNPDVAALGCRLLNADGSFSRWTGGSSPSLRSVACHFLFLNKVLPHSILPQPLYLESDPRQDLQVGWVSGACMLLRAQALGAAIFDERFFLYGEDLDLCARLIRGGWKVLYTPKARIIHLEGRSLTGQSPEIQVSKVRAMRQLFAKSRGQAALIAYDLIVTTGFVMRTILFGIAAYLRPGCGYELRTARSRQFSLEAMRALMRR